MPAHQTYLTRTEVEDSTDNSLTAIIEGVGGYDYATRNLAQAEWNKRYPSQAGLGALSARLGKSLLP